MNSSSPPYPLITETPFVASEKKENTGERDKAWKKKKNLLNLILIYILPSILFNSRALFL